MGADGGRRVFFRRGGTAADFLCWRMTDRLLQSNIIPASSEPSGRAGASVWRTPQGTLRAGGARLAPAERERRPNFRRLCCIVYFQVFKKKCIHRIWYLRKIGEHSVKIHLRNLYKSHKVYNYQQKLFTNRKKVIYLTLSLVNPV